MVRKTLVCDTCKGTGYCNHKINTSGIFKLECPDCRGDGFITKDVKLPRSG